MISIHKPTRFTATLLIGAALTGTGGCQSGGDSETAMREPAAEPATPATPAIPQGPGPAAEMRTIKTTPAMVAQGKALFGACGACHGAEGDGKIGQGPRLNSETFLAAATDKFLRDTIEHGRAGTTMVAWGSSFKPEQIDSLVAYIRSLHPIEPAKLNEKPLTANLEHGEEIYQSICYTCHGRSGAGYQETANGTGIGRTAFLNTVTNGYIRYVAQHGKSQTQMKGFGGAKLSVANLDENEIDDVIGYLRTQAW